MMGSGSAASGIPQRCFHCKEMSEQLRPGWQLQDGNFAGLCYTCSSTYENGSFCGLNHLWLDGWRECKGCRDYIHCGCVMSPNLYVLADTNSILCARCFRAATCIRQMNPVPALDLNQPVLADEETAPAPNAPGLTTPNAADPELQEEINTSTSQLSFLFDKILSPTDSNPKFGRLVLPKQAAEDHLGMLSKSRVVPMTFHDPHGKEWVFTYRRWSGSKQYVLEGLKEYMLEKKCQAGHKVKFYRNGPGGKLVIAV